ncbi:MAG TPA: MBL fold metallo-hydrolase [Candidatus Paceibacterota bacterium]|jgi:L-ascorbate metabolism protein UlaG (beta-lactamase superfamily)
MVISYYGGEFFKVSFGDTTLAFNPISKDSKLKGTRFGSDIALVSMHHPDMDGVDQVAHGDRQPFVVDGPGEYEVKKTFIRGFATRSQFGVSKEKEERQNTMFLVQLEGMHLCFLGALSSKELPKEAVAVMDTVDVLFIPIGGSGVLTASEAHSLAVEIEPALVIPMHYQTTEAGGDMGEKDALKKFLKEEGADVKPIEKLTIKKKDLEGKEGEVVVLAG